MLDAQILAWRWSARVSSVNHVRDRGSWGVCGNLCLDPELDLNSPILKPISAGTSAGFEVCGFGCMRVEMK